MLSVPFQMTRQLLRQVHNIPVRLDSANEMAINSQIEKETKDRDGKRAKKIKNKGERKRVSLVGCRLHLCYDAVWGSG